MHKTRNLRKPGAVAKSNMLLVHIDRTMVRRLQERIIHAFRSLSLPRGSLLHSILNTTSLIRPSLPVLPPPPLPVFSRLLGPDYSVFEAPTQHEQRLTRIKPGSVTFDMDTAEVRAAASSLSPERDKWGAPVWPEEVELVRGRHPLAGRFRGLCYRTACQRPDAVYYNRSTRQHYCTTCARDLNRVNPEKWEDSQPLCVLRTTEQENLDSRCLFY